MLAKAFAVSFVILFLACSQPEPEIETEIIRVPVVKEVPVEVIREVPVVTVVVTEIPVEVLVAVAPTQCPNQQDIDNTLAWLEEARASHVWWADYLSTHAINEAVAKEGLGTASLHQAWVSRYTTMIGVTQAIEAIC